METTKRIAVVRFPINDVGGIDPYYVNLRRGFESLGHSVTLIHCSSQMRMKLDRLTSRQFYHPGEFRSYRFSDVTEETRRYLETFDVVIFLHPSPHPTSDNLAKPGSSNWKKLYDLEDTKVIQIHHDERWEDTNYWCHSVAEHCDLVIAAQHRFLPAVEKYPADCRKEWEYFPLDVNETVTRKENKGVVATQWIQWKNHKHFVPRCKDIITPIHFYGAGIIYHYMKKDGTLQEGIGTNMVTNEIYNDLLHRYHGFVLYEQVQHAMAQSLFSIDLSTRGYTNMTHWEPMLHGTIPVMSSQVMADPYNEIPEDCAITFDDWDQLVWLCNTMPAQETRGSVVENGRKFIKVCDKTQVAHRFLEYLL